MTITLAYPTELGPKREAVRDGDHWIVRITPASWTSFKNPSEIVLTHDQYGRYLAWLQTGVHLLVNILPELTNRQRELLICGISSDDDK
jgi:hypothetical protein